MFGKKNGKVESLLYSGDREKILAMVREMGSMASEAFRLAVQSLEERDDALAERVIEEDDAIDDLEATIDHECLCSIAMRQPVREDLRFVFAVLKIITDLERIGDQGVNIAKKAKVLNRYPLLKPLVDIPKMKVIATEMVADSLKAFEENDTLLAEAICMRDGSWTHCTTASSTNSSTSWGKSRRATRRPPSAPRGCSGSLVTWPV